MAENNHRKLNGRGGRKTTNMVAGDDTGVGPVVGSPAGPIGTIVAAVAGRELGNQIGEGSNKKNGEGSEQ